MAHRPSRLAPNVHAHVNSRSCAAPLKVSVAYPRMIIKSCPNSRYVHTISFSFSHYFLTVTGLFLIFAALAFDYSILSHLSSNISAPFRSSSISALRFSSTTMPSAHKSSKPPSKKQLGQAGWTLIHSIAANYPQSPSENEQYHAKAFLRSIGKLYPCKRCRQHFQKHLAASPPDLSSREQFMLWACNAHNAVNKRQGKPEFPCRMSKLEQRWGDCGCQLKSGTKK